MAKYLKKSKLYNQDFEENNDIDYKTSFLQQLVLQDEKKSQELEERKKKEQSNDLTKMISLVTLTLQSTSATLVASYSRSVKGSDGHIFLISTAVVMTELIKFSICLLVTLYQYFIGIITLSTIFPPLNKEYTMKDSYQIKCVDIIEGENMEEGEVGEMEENKLTNSRQEENEIEIDVNDKGIIKRGLLSSLPISIPALLYSIQGNLLYIGISNLPLIVYHTTHQFKLFTTAVFTVVLLSRTLSIQQWLALCTLVLGLVLVTYSTTQNHTNYQNTNNQKVSHLSHSNHTTTSNIPSSNSTIHKNNKFNQTSTIYHSFSSQPLPLSSHDPLSQTPLNSTSNGMDLNQNNNQNNQNNNQIVQNNQNIFIGLLAVFLSSVSSGYAGVYFERILKNSVQSIWVRNVQLSFFGTIFSFLITIIHDSEKISKDGWFQGYNIWTLLTIALQALGGLVVAFVVKYADNIAKDFATSISLVLTALYSVFYFSFPLDSLLILGASLVCLSLFWYHHFPPPPPPPPHPYPQNYSSSSSSSTSTISKPKSISPSLSTFISSSSSPTSTLIKIPTLSTSSTDSSLYYFSPTSLPIPHSTPKFSPSVHRHSHHEESSTTNES